MRIQHSGRLSVTPHLSLEEKLTRALPATAALARLTLALTLTLTAAEAGRRPASTILAAPGTRRRSLCPESLSPVRSVSVRAVIAEPLT